MIRHCNNLSGTQPTGANPEKFADLHIWRQIGEGDAARRREVQREQLAHVVTACLIWIVAPLVGASLAVGLVWFGVCWLRSH